MNYYAGIGSRMCPFHIGLLCADIAEYLGKKGYVLRSGGARGCDVFFEKGAGQYRKEIFLAKNSTVESEKYSEKFHPNWKSCNEYVRKLHARNSMIILGKYLDTPVKCVICWTQDGKITGGTGHSLRIAEFNGIKIFNLYFDDVQKYFINKIQGF